MSLQAFIRIGNLDFNQYLIYKSITTLCHQIFKNDKMKAQKNVRIGSQIFIGISALSLGYVALLSIFNPQSTMDLVATTLPNTDAISSIRGIYGGVGLVITIQLIYLLIKDHYKGLLFLSLFWGAYALSRLITIFSDGALGDFGNQWIVIESTFCVVAFILLLLSKNKLQKAIS